MACLNYKGEYKTKARQKRNARRGYRISDISRIARYLEADGAAPETIIAAVIYNTSLNEKLLEQAGSSQDLSDKFKAVTALYDAATVSVAIAALWDVYEDVKDLVGGTLKSGHSSVWESFLSFVKSTWSFAKWMPKLFTFLKVLPLVGAIVEFVQLLYDEWTRDAEELVYNELISINEEQTVQQLFYADCVDVAPAVLVDARVFKKAE
jgi:hypothetical protein